MKLRDLPIDALMVNPGTIKPTGLQDNGKANLERAWGMMPPAAKEEYGSLLDAFVKWGEAEPGTHPSGNSLKLQFFTFQIVLLNLDFFCEKSKKERK